jgi:hypothetical protein
VAGCVEPRVLRLVGQALPDGVNNQQT